MASVQRRRVLAQLGLADPLSGRDLGLRLVEGDEVVGAPLVGHQLGPGQPDPRQVGVVLLGVRGILGIEQLQLRVPDAGLLVRVVVSPDLDQVTGPIPVVA